MAVAYQVLGPIRVLVDGLDVTPAAHKERALLAMLVINRGRVVSADRLIDELWNKLPVARARRTLQVRVAALRKVLMDASSESALQFVFPGYRLAVGAEAADEHHFFSLVDEARDQLTAGEPASAGKLLRAALDLWRGEPLEDVQVCLSLEAEANRLAEARLAAVEDLLTAELVCGHPQAVVAATDGLTAIHPLRETLWARRILALYRCGRQADALRTSAVIRRRLAEDLGLDPGRELQSLELAVLQHDPSLDAVDGGEPPAIERRPVGPVARPEWEYRRPPGPEEMPPIRYCRTSAGVNLAYQVFGDGDLDVVIVPGLASHLETWWEAGSGRLVRRLASFARVVLYDKRGMGLSDRPACVTLDDWVEDIGVVLDAADIAQAAVIGVSVGGVAAMLFAATAPERTRALVLFGAGASARSDEDYPWGVTAEELESWAEALEGGWGSGVGLDVWCPSVADDSLARRQFARFQRISASPGAVAAYVRGLIGVDIRRSLTDIRAPTLVMHATGDRDIPVDVGRYLASRIPNATLVELDSDDHLIWFSDAVDVMTDSVEAFLTTPSHRTRG